VGGVEVVGGATGGGAEGEEGVDTGDGGVHSGGEVEHRKSPFSSSTVEGSSGILLSVRGCCCCR